MQQVLNFVCNVQTIHTAGCVLFYKSICSAM